MAKEVDMAEVVETLTQLKGALKETHASLKEMKDSDTGLSGTQVEEMIKTMTAGLGAKINTALKGIKTKVGDAPSPKEMSEKRVKELVTSGLDEYFADDDASEDTFLDGLAKELGITELLGE